MGRAKVAQKTNKQTNGRGSRQRELSSLARPSLITGDSSPFFAPPQFLLVSATVRSPQKKGNTERIIPKKKSARRSSSWVTNLLRTSMETERARYTSVGNPLSKLQRGYRPRSQSLRRKYVPFPQSDGQSNPPENKGKTGAISLDGGG